MERQTQINIRLHLEEKAAILKRAKEEKLSLSDFMRRAAMKGLVPKTEAGMNAAQERIAKEYEVHESPESFNRAARVNIESRETAEASVAPRVKQLIASGTSPERAERQARKELGL